MIGYWFIWSNLIVIILWSCGFKQLILQYVTSGELFLYFLLSYILLSYYNVILYAVDDGTLQFNLGTLFVFLPLMFIIARNNINSLLLLVLSSGLLALMYCLIYTLFIIYRGYEPSMNEWLLFVSCIVLMLVFTIKKSQLLLTVLLAKLFGDLLLYWHQQGQVSVKIGDFSWWEFTIFLWISSLCIYECLFFLAKRMKLLRVN